MPSNSAPIASNFVQEFADSDDAGSRNTKDGENSARFRPWRVNTQLSGGFPSIHSRRSTSIKNTRNARGGGNPYRSNKFENRRQLKMAINPAKRDNKKSLTPVK